VHFLTYDAGDASDAAAAAVVVLERVAAVLESVTGTAGIRDDRYREIDAAATPVATSDTLSFSHFFLFYQKRLGRDKEQEARGGGGEGTVEHLVLDVQIPNVVVVVLLILLIFIIIIISIIIIKERLSVGRETEDEGKRMLVLLSFLLT
jgi:hypothetical protein